MKENKEILQVIGSNIKEARNQKGYTQGNLAEKFNTSDKFISMLERGVNGMNITNIPNLCNVLEIEPNSIFKGLINYNDDRDTYIVNSLSTLTNEDKEFIINTIKYVLNKNSK